MGGVRGSVTHESWSLGLGLMLCFYFLSHLHVVESTKYIVGGKTGWSFNVRDWPRGKPFKAGDVLVFRYAPSVHNVVVVDAKGYYNCLPEPGAKVYNSGDDKITLAKGDNYFICSILGHCKMDMRIAVHAA